MNVGDITAGVIAVSGVVGTFTAYHLSKRGQRNDERQQAAATKLQERITSFDELESLNDRLTTENARLRDLYAEAETRGDVRLASQAQRCRAALEQSMEAMASLQSVVLSEIAKASADDVRTQVSRHLEQDHPETP